MLDLSYPLLEEGLRCIGLSFNRLILTNFVGVYLRSMAKMNGARLDEEWVMQQAMAMRAMEHVRRQP